jgi:indolepyruvate ferredoxin oxidoreductase beta subunit
MASRSGTTSVVLVGVGGQGVLLASEILAQAAVEAGYDVKTNEIHGMAQRGGSVIAQIRFGHHVHSPLVAPGTARVLGALEQIEALRHPHFLAAEGRAVVSRHTIVPVSVSAGQATYPADAEARLHESFPRLMLVDAESRAAEIGAPWAANVIVLGAISAELALPEAAWETSIRRCVKPPYAALNLRAFASGRALNAAAT